MNTQPIEKFKSSRLLQIHSIFKTIQGEGPHSGKRSVFIRLAGCNLQCPGCDTDYTSKRQELYYHEIISQVSIVADPPFLIVITGGEPFRQDISELCIALLSVGYKVQVETNGTLPPPENLPKAVEIVCSPKTGKINHLVAKRLTALKYVIDHRSVDARDGLPIKALEHNVRGKVYRHSDKNIPVYVTPFDSGNKKEDRLNVASALNSCAMHGYIFQFQIHKLLGVE